MKWVYIEYDDRKELWCSVIYFIFKDKYKDVMFCGESLFLNQENYRMVYMVYGLKKINKWKKDKKLLLIYKIYEGEEDF